MGPIESVREVIRLAAEKTFVNFCGSCATLEDDGDLIWLKGVEKPRYT
jgi:hypothetical protein